MTFSNVCLPLRDLKRRGGGDSGMCSRDNADNRDSLMKGQDVGQLDSVVVTSALEHSGRCSSMPNNHSNGYHSLGGATGTACQDAPIR